MDRVVVEPVFHGEREQIAHALPVEGRGDLPGAAAFRGDPQESRRVQFQLRDRAPRQPGDPEGRAAHLGQDPETGVGSPDPKLSRVVRGKCPNVVNEGGGRRQGVEPRGGVPFHGPERVEPVGGAEPHPVLPGHQGTDATRARRYGRRAFARLGTQRQQAGPLGGDPKRTEIVVGKTLDPAPAPPLRGSKDLEEVPGVTGDVTRRMAEPQIPGQVHVCGRHDVVGNPVADGEVREGVAVEPGQPVVRAGPKVSLAVLDDGLDLALGQAVLDAVVAEHRLLSGRRWRQRQQARDRHGTDSPATLHSIHRRKPHGTERNLMTVGRSGQDPELDRDFGSNLLIEPSREQPRRLDFPGAFLGHYQIEDGEAPLYW